MKDLLSDPSGDLDQHHCWEDSRSDSYLIGEHIIYNEYWRRAWIVQEIVLAREAVISLDA
jgi:hypothetical protein